VLSQPPHLEVVTTRRGQTGVIYVRDQTSDLSLALGTFSNSWATGDDEYDLEHLHVEGVFVDIGAHIGVVSLAVLMDNPGAQAILVEPIPENLAMARRTMAENALADRASYVEAAVGRSTISYGTTEDDRFVGNIGSHAGEVIVAPLVTLPQLVKMAGGRIAAMKLDCEGGEWNFLRSSAIRHVDLIFGEWHGTTKRRDGPTRLRALLDATHDFTLLTDVGGIGLFRAVRR
jgi:FkbM family methyltransferase